MMKKIFYSVFLIWIYSLLSLSQGSESSLEDPYIKSLTQNVQLKLEIEHFTCDLSGFKVESFPSDEKDRNHYDERMGGTLASIQSLVIHYTALDLHDTLNIFTKNQSSDRVSATYVISQSETFVKKEVRTEPEVEPESHTTIKIPGGVIIRVVPDDKRAWHAGISHWRDLRNLNHTSIGIENVNKGFIVNADNTLWFEFDPDQIHSLGLLSQALVKKYQIKPMYIVGHADICPGIKSDPGPLFPWETLYTRYSVGAWLASDERTPEEITKRYSPKENFPQGIDLQFLSRQLQKFGYKIEINDEITSDFTNVLKAFKAHFSQNQHPERYNDAPDEIDMFWAWGLNSKYEFLYPAS